MLQDADDDREDAAPPAPALTAAEQALLARLRAIDPNELRPRDALDLLYELYDLAAAPDADH
jgi:DNA mismatch repair protein MutS